MNDTPAPPSRQAALRRMAQWGTKGATVQETAKRLREAARYDPETGIFTRADGSVPAISLDSDGYQRIYISGIRGRVHRLAWLYMTGEWPSEEIDHADTNRQNNRWANLRKAGRRLNQANRRMSRANTSGIKGVRWHKGNKRWVAQIGINRKRTHLGSFSTKEEAAAAYQAAAIALWGEFAKPTEVSIRALKEQHNEQG